MSAKATIKTEIKTTGKPKDINVKQLVKDVSSQCAKLLYYKIKEISNEAIARYYNAYAPHMYKRKESLYDAVDFGIRNGEDFYWEYGADLINARHRASNEYIFDVMFMEGWHGGAKSGAGHPSPGTPHWKYPPTARNMYLEEYDEIVYVETWTLWYPSPAAKSTAPFDMIMNAWSAYINGEFLIERKKIALQCFKKYIK